MCPDHLSSQTAPAGSKEPVVQSAPGSDDHAPAGGPDTNNSVEAVNNIATTTRRTRAATTGRRTRPTFTTSRLWKPAGASAGQRWRTWSG